MNNLISINRGRFLADYTSKNTGSTFERTAFFAGVLLTVVLPQTIYCASHGPVPSIAFAATALVGTIVGVTRYRQSSYWPDSSVAKRIVPRASQDDDTTMKPAA